MRRPEHPSPAFPPEFELTPEERLRLENEELKRQLQDLQGAAQVSTHGGMPTRFWHPSGLTVTVLILLVVVIGVGAFIAGYTPLRKRQALIVQEAREQEETLPRVDVISVGRSGGKSELQLPGNIQAITEAPVLARADGYISQRFVDIGDRVKTGAALAIIQAPELDQQAQQSRAAVRQTQASLDQAIANLQQGKSEMELSRVTAERWGRLLKQGAVSSQENDQYQAQYQSKIASVQALEKAINVQRSNVAAAEANLARIEQMLSYRTVRAPFDGVITLRNVDVGALVTTGTTLLFRIAQTGKLRTYVNVPQAHANSIHVGQPALLTVSNVPGREFKGTVARSASALDPASRTLLVEVQVPNNDGILFPGMYAQVDLSSARRNPPLLVPSDALVVRGNGAQVAVVSADHHVHLQKIEVGRDYGDKLEVVSGLSEGDTIIPNPGDAAREGLKVNPVRADAKIAE